MNADEMLAYTGQCDPARMNILTDELTTGTGTRADREERDRALRTMYALAWADAVTFLAGVARETETSDVPTSVCGCGYELVYGLEEGWFHDAAPERWGDDHAPHPEPDDEAKGKAYAADNGREYLEA